MKHTDMLKHAENLVRVNEISRVATGAKIKGDLSSSTDIRIDGSVEGNISSTGRIVVGEHAVLVGDVTCDNLDIWGKLNGNVFAKDTLTLKSTAVVTGDIHVRRLSVELGARLNGSCFMTEK